MHLKSLRKFNFVLIENRLHFTYKTRSISIWKTLFSPNSTCKRTFCDNDVTLLTWKKYRVKRYIRMLCKGYYVLLTLHWNTIDGVSSLTLFVNCVSIIKLCTCFSARVSSSFLETTATNKAVHPAPCKYKKIPFLANFLANLNSMYNIYLCS